MGTASLQMNKLFRTIRCLHINQPVVELDNNDGFTAGIWSEDEWQFKQRDEPRHEGCGGTDRVRDGPWRNSRGRCEQKETERSCGFGWETGGVGGADELGSGNDVKHCDNTCEITLTPEICECVPESAHGGSSPADGPHCAPAGDRAVRAVHVGNTKLDRWGTSLRVGNCRNQQGAVRTGRRPVSHIRVRK